MKKIIFFLLGILFCSLLKAQVPQGISHQAVIRNSLNEIVTNSTIGIRVSILQGSPTGTVVYMETHTPVSNANGLITYIIGQGVVGTGDFNTIDWSTGSYYLKTEADPTGGSNYTITGTSQLLSVPYALYASNINLIKNGKLWDLYIKNDGNIVALQKLTIEAPCDSVPTVADIDGNSYNTVKIGTQVWMSENLKTTKYNDDTSIPLVSDNLSWFNLTTPGYCWYNNDQSTYGNTYGAIYNWYTINTDKLCPIGWHVPTDAEWTTLTTYLGLLAGGRMKESGITHWSSPNVDAINDSKFTALPGGFRTIDGTFNDTGNRGYWWSSSEYDTTFAWVLGVTYFLNYVSRDYYVKNYGFSVRCLMD
jgi:uncharacterized protein (TIGR02145 family)